VMAADVMKMKSAKTVEGEEVKNITHFMTL
jgi:hypothetical protein